MTSFVTQTALTAFLRRLDAAFARPGRLLLVGETTLVCQGWRPWTETLEYAAEVAPEDRAAFDRAVAEVAGDLGLALWQESPADVIPLPDGYENRHRPVAGEVTRRLRLYHFDPYSVAFRFIARGDEPDYHLVLTLLDHGWLTVEELEASLATLLPRFSMDTIAQDPAEFKRKYKGLLQMWRAVRPGTIHRPTPA